MICLKPVISSMLIPLIIRCEMASITLFVIHLNIGRLQKNIDKLSDYICTFDKQPAVIALSETKLKPITVYDNIDLNGYAFIRSDSATLLGGVGMYIKESLTFTTKRNLDCNLPLIEETLIDLETNFGLITIGVACRHLVRIKNNVNKSEIYLYNLREKFNNKSHPYYIFGGLNLDLLKIESIIFYVENII